MIQILQILTILSFIKYSKADTINFITPTSGQIFTNPIIDVNYQIQRNGMLFISNTTTDLLDGTLLLNSIFTDTTVNTNVNVQLDTKTMSNTNSNFNIRVTGFGKYNLISGTATNLNIQNFIPISIDLKNVRNLPTVIVPSTSVTLPKPNVIVFSQVQSVSVSSVSSISSVSVSSISVPSISVTSGVTLQKPVVIIQQTTLTIPTTLTTPTTPTTPTTVQSTNLPKSTLNQPTRSLIQPTNNPTISVNLPNPNTVGIIQPKTNSTTSPTAIISNSEINVKVTYLSILSLFMIFVF